MHVLLITIAMGHMPFEPELNNSGEKISSATVDGNGFLVHSVESVLQKGPTTLRVLLPNPLEKDKRYPVIYLLPVEAKNGARYGDGLAEIKQRELQNKYAVIVVQPTFSSLPWYADHATDSTLAQERYFLKVVLPYVEKTYPVLRKREGRLLLGFSKSGWGAFSLLMRRPNVFERAAAWDAPLTMEKPNRFGMGPIFGTQANFEKYRLTALAQKQADVLRAEKRLAILGHCNFGKHHETFHTELLRLKISHSYLKERLKTHTWNAGWLEPGVRFLTGKDQ